MIAQLDAVDEIVSPNTLRPTALLHRVFAVASLIVIVITSRIDELNRTTATHRIGMEAYCVPSFSFSILRRNVFSRWSCALCLLISLICGGRRMWSLCLSVWPFGRLCVPGTLWNLWCVNWNLNAITCHCLYVILFGYADVIRSMRPLFPAH